MHRLKRPSFQILLSCILFPPLLYVLTLQGLERIVQERWNKGLQGVVISDTQSLLDGRTTIVNEIKRNIDKYLSDSAPTKWGVLPRITVITKTGRHIYPHYDEDMLQSFYADTFVAERPAPGKQEALQIAQRNLSIMDEGIKLSVDAEIPRDTLLANGILGFYIVGFGFLLYVVHRLSTNHALELNRRRLAALDAARAKLQSTRSKLNKMVEREVEQQGQIKKLEYELGAVSQKVKATEDVALAEMEALEKDLHHNIGLREKLQSEVDRLSSELMRLEATQEEQNERSRKVLEKGSTKAAKRFATLYKNIILHTRAVEGFVSLEGDMQLRAEEMIHRMNEDPKQLPVKRKIFSGKASLRVLESEFGYGGRIYWRHSQEQGTKAEVLGIGTKNTQSKDLAYLEGNG